MITKQEYESYVAILEEELVPAMGCTEPIALSYAGALAQKFLKEPAVRAIAHCSGNIIKNVKCVRVPNTGGLVGIEAAVVSGIVAGDPSLKLEVISKLNDEDRINIKKALNHNLCEVKFLESAIPLHIVVEVFGESHHVSVEITKSHTHVEKIMVDGQPANLDSKEGSIAERYTDRSCLTLEKILEFANTCNLDDVRTIISRQIECNMAISDEGMTGKYGLDIGHVLTKDNNCLEVLMSARAAAASEARMDGCPLPVVTNSGSGNQGITTSIPIIVYCRENNIDEETIYRALVFSNLCTIHEKTGIGRLSAFCGAVCAATSAGATLTYLKGGTLEQIGNTVRNNFADISGIVCDGAKTTCALKIHTSLQAAFLASKMALCGKTYDANTGILKASCESTIDAIGVLGKQGMKETDKVILNIMLEKE